MSTIRCIIVVKLELKKIGVHHFKVDLGSAELHDGITDKQLEKFKIALLNVGLELLTDRKSIFIENIKTAIIEMILFWENNPKTKTSEFLSKKLNYDYTYISNLFKEVTGINIRQYIINYKIEHVKQFIIYDKYSQLEICKLLKYSSKAHLANQFKKTTGLTISEFKQYYKKQRALKIK